MPDETTPDVSEGFNLDRLRAALFLIPRPGVFAQDDRFEGDISDDALIPAAVLFPIILRERAASVLLTQRSAHLRDHPGQISFPGGRAEPSDASLAGTALREASEEIGLPSASAEVLGYLPDYRTGTGFCVTPVVALLTPPFQLLPDGDEVAEIFEVPLAFLLNPVNHKRHSTQHAGRLRQFYAFSYEGRFIWGATAGIIVALSHALGLSS